MRKAPRAGLALSLWTRRAFDRLRDGACECARWWVVTAREWVWRGEREVPHTIATQWENSPTAGTFLPRTAHTQTRSRGAPRGEREVSHSIATQWENWLFAVEGVGGAGPANRCDEALSAGEDFDQLIHRGGATDALRCPIEPAREPDRRARLGEGVLAVDVD